MRTDQTFQGQRLDQRAALGEITGRPLFGGHGLDEVSPNVLDERETPLSWAREPIQAGEVSKR